MHLPPLIADLSIILAVAGLMSIIFQWLKQPVVLGYILAGVIVGPYTPPFQLVKDIPGVQTWAELGVIFLMFTLGLEFSFRKLLNVGVTAGVTAGLEVLFFLIVGFGIGQWLGWSMMDSLFLGAMLSISSTTIIIKALEELKLKNHRFSSLIFGVLIVEDLFAILLLVGLTTIATSGNFSFFALASAGLHLTIVVGGWFITGYFLIPRLMEYVARKGNNEMLTLVSISLCLSLVVIASHFGYSAALGAFIMGSILAETKVLHRIEDLMGPLRDLFGGIFFVSIGMLIDPKIMWEYKGTITLLCFVTVVGKIFITSLGSLISGQSFKNSIQVGFGLAQIGEFSFIIAGLGVALKATSNKLYPIGVAVSLVTTFTTPYLIKYSRPFADGVEARLPWKVKELMNRYVEWVEHGQGGSDKFKGIPELITRWVMNGIVVTLIFNLCFEYILPLIGENLADLARWKKHITWLIAFVVSTPFLWGMVFTSRKNYLRIRKEKSTFKAIVVLFLPILTSVWIGILSGQHFKAKFILPLTVLFLIVIYFALFKKLESYYRWLEKTFLSTFEEDEEKKSALELSGLAPWDSHLVNVQVHPNSSLVNMTLIESNLRQRLGVNVVAVQRGLQTIIAPKPQEKILPGDILVVLGTDEQIDSARPELEIPANISDMFGTEMNYRLRHLKVTGASGISGKTIRQSGIREKYHAMVVGIERAHNRMINPDTDLELKSEDIIWVVGEKTKLEQLFSELG